MAIIQPKIQAAQARNLAKKRFGESFLSWGAFKHRCPAVSQKMGQEKDVAQDGHRPVGRISSCKSISLLLLGQHKLGLGLYLLTLV